MGKISKRVQKPENFKYIHLFDTTEYEAHNEIIEWIDINKPIPNELLKDIGYFHFTDNGKRLNVSKTYVCEGEKIKIDRLKAIQKMYDEFKLKHASVFEVLAKEKSCIPVNLIYELFDAIEDYSKYHSHNGKMEDYVNDELKSNLTLKQIESVTKEYANLKHRINRKYPKLADLLWYANPSTDPYYGDMLTQVAEIIDEYKNNDNSKAVVLANGYHFILTDRAVMLSEARDIKVEKQINKENVL